MTDAETDPPFRLAYAPGVTPAKWVRIWGERLPDVSLALVAVSAGGVAGVLRDGDADVGLVRLPIDRTGLSAIPLYAETTVVLIPKDHELAGVEEVSVEDLADAVVLHPLDDCLEWERLPGVGAKERPETTADAVELVAAGVGLLVLPQSLARLHHRRDLTYRPVGDAPQSRVALSWVEERTTDLVEEFIGIVRGRTVNSSRGRGATAVGEQAKQTKQSNQMRDESGGGARRKPAAGRSGSRGAKPGKPRRRA